MIRVIIIKVGKSERDSDLQFTKPFMSHSTLKRYVQKLLTVLLKDQSSEELFPIKSPWLVRGRQAKTDDIVTFFEWQVCSSTVLGTSI